ncbi:hypothetical protein ERJ75_000896900 [Trypanosoma vivax]|nr:hypothetical protein ERJ75_000896900 [Trypanosoma vivax]
MRGSLAASRAVPLVCMLPPRRCAHPVRRVSCDALRFLQSAGVPREVARARPPFFVRVSETATRASGFQSPLVWAMVVPSATAKQQPMVEHGAVVVDCGLCHSPVLSSPARRIGGPRQVERGAVCACPAGCAIRARREASIEKAPFAEHALPHSDRKAVPARRCVADVGNRRTESRARTANRVPACATLPAESSRSTALAWTQIATQRPRSAPGAPRTQRRGWPAIRDR